MFEDYRQQINQIDQQMVGLWEERIKIVEEIAAIKQAQGMEVLDEEREIKVIEQAKSYLSDPDLSPLLEEFMQEVLRLSRKHQVTWMNQHEEE
ncbi:chorismate mutase [Ignavigranum ruoffiae]|uniref:Chorismate mutase n=1 Tax=Ignavigranum ruoffiae TaxID=89093 RepID=A0A1H9ER28_9LACT|nr:chorismate mutase [Ignavigranum ruoffiae]UPQ85897.1 chorismate mutase [Ignavigranum ruoffiae]SEQ28119.1 chorismate mutase [Ignavigranum ruoffiae]